MNIAKAQEVRLLRARRKGELPVSTQRPATPPATVLTQNDREQVLNLFTSDAMTMGMLREAWLEKYEPRQHLRWWITLVLAGLNDKSQVSIRFTEQGPVWSIIQI